MQSFLDEGAGSRDDGIFGTLGAGTLMRELVFVSERSSPFKILETFAGSAH